MMNRTLLILGGLTMLALAAPAFAGTTTVDFVTNTGLLTHTASGPGSLASHEGRAYFTGQNMTLLEQSGSVISSGETTSMTMTLTPSLDAGEGVGLVMIGDNDEILTAICGSDGTVTIMDWIGNYQTLEFPYPAAVNNSFTLQYNASTETATLTLNLTDSVSLYVALNGASSVQVGVASNGVAGFARLVATGPGIPDYPPVGVDTDDDGVMDDVEAAAGTDPHDPGNLPVYNTPGADIHALNGAMVVILAGSLPSSTVNVAVSAPYTIPSGPVPAGRSLSGAGVELEPDGTSFSSPVAVTLPYTPGSIAGLIESSLTVVYFDGANYSSTGIAGVDVDTAGKTVTFTTTHFTTFVIAGDLADTDGDGIDDSWEMEWFDNLDTANATSDYDGDGISDLAEFQLRGLGLDPTQPDAPLPVTGALGAAVLAALILAIGGRRRRP
jgi:hypothetical protein